MNKFFYRYFSKFGYFPVLWRKYTNQWYYWRIYWSLKREYKNKGRVNKK